jgi:uncharacterized protein
VPDRACAQYRGCHVWTWIFNREKSSIKESCGRFCLHRYRRRSLAVHRARRASLQDYDGGVLLLAGAATILRRDGAGAPDREAPFWGVLSVGVVVGLISGFTGVSGGVFLAPTLIGLQWASPKQAAALSAPFILANSAVDLIGVFLGGQLPAPHFGLYALMALGGAVLGTAIGLRWLGQAATRFILAAILLAAGIQLLFF